MGVLQSGVVLAAKVLHVATFPAAERAAYHAALVTLAREDLGWDVAAWRARGARAGTTAAKAPATAAPAPAAKAGR